MSYQPFLSYPHADFIRLAVAAASALHPSVPLGEGLRRIGQSAYDALLPSLAGKILFGVLGVDFEQVLTHGPKGYALAVTFGSVEFERLGPGHARYTYRAMPALLDTYHVGVIEGAMRHCKVEGEVLVATTDLANAVFDITWK